MYIYNLMQFLLNYFTQKINSVYSFFLIGILSSFLKQKVY